MGGDPLPPKPGKARKEERMLIPSIDLMGGRIVQLVQGEKLKLAFDDFEYWIERFSKYPHRPVDRPRRRHAPGREPQPH